MIISLLIYLIISAMNLMEYILMGYIILGWFVFFGAVKDRDGVFFRIYIFLMSKIEPILVYIRQYLPTVAGLDFSPLVVFVALHFAKVLLWRLQFVL